MSSELHVIFHHTGPGSLEIYLEIHPWPMHQEVAKYPLNRKTGSLWQNWLTQKQFYHVFFYYDCPRVLAALTKLWVSIQVTTFIDLRIRLRIRLRLFQKMPLNECLSMSI